MVFSTREGISIPIPPPEGSSLDEFLEPGDSPVIGTKTPYFTNYYSTWSSYIVVDSLGYYNANSPYIETAAPTREVIAPITLPTNKLRFSISLARIFPNGVPDYIYFDIISVNYPTTTAISPNLQKYLKDHAAPPNRSISKTFGSVLTETDETKLRLMEV
jgi:hypothetical protein